MYIYKGSFFFLNKSKVIFYSLSARKKKANTYMQENCQTSTDTYMEVTYFCPRKIPQVASLIKVETQFFGQGERTC